MLRTLAWMTICFALTAGCENGSSFGGSSDKLAKTPSQVPLPTDTGTTATSDATPLDSSPNATVAPTDTAIETDFDGRLDSQGAQTGAIQISLLWDSDNDLDLYVQTPKGELIYYANDRDSTGGYLDVDMNFMDDDLSMTPVENVYWPSDSVQHGHYKVYVHHFHLNSGANPTPFKVRIKIGVQISFYSGQATYAAFSDDFGGGLPDNAVAVHDFTY